MGRITRRIGDAIEFVDGKGYANLSHEEVIKLLFKTLADCEDRLEKGSVMRAYFQVEDFLYGSGKDKPLEIKSAMVWGALMVAFNHGDIDWDSARNLFGEFMSKQMNLR
jgi:hypothetical protein